MQRPLSEQKSQPEKTLPPLVLAASADDMQEVARLLADHANPNTLLDGEPLLIWAVRTNHVPLINLLLNAGAKKDTRDKKNCTAFSIALAWKNIAAAEALLANEARCDRRPYHLLLRDKHGRTLLDVAARKGHLAVVKKLLAEGANVNPNLPGTQSALHCAARGGHFIVANTLIAAGSDREARDQNGDTALHIAAERGHIGMIDALLKEIKEQKSNPVDPVAKDGMTPFLRAVKHNQIEAVKQLLEAKANINACDLKQDSALHLAVQNGNRSMVELLVSAKINTKNENTDGLTALLLAANVGNLDILRYLLTTLPHNAATLEKLFHLAAYHGHEGIVTELLTREVNVNCKDENGNTALDLAAMKNHSHVMKTLLANKSDVSSRNKAGQTALHHAAFHDSLDCVNILVDEKMQASDVDFHGQNSFFTACAAGHARIVSALLNQMPKENLSNGNLLDDFKIAIDEGQAGVVELLLNCGLVVNRKDPCFLNFAMQRGHEKLAKVLVANQFACTLNTPLQASPELKLVKKQIDDLTPFLVAAKNGKTEEVKRMIAEGKENLTATDIHGNCALHLAARHGHVETTEALLSIKHKITRKPILLNLQNKAGVTPLMTSIRYKKSDIAHLLMAAGAEVDLKDQNEAKAVHHAGISGLHDVIYAIAKICESRFGSSVDEEDCSGNTTLHYAAANGHTDAIDFLLDTEAVMPDVSNNLGTTPLHYAAIRNQVECADHLLAFKADINARNQRGRTALHIAAMKGHIDMVKFLLRKKAETQHTDMHGCTALLLAISHGHFDCADQILKNMNVADINKKNHVGQNAFALTFPKNMYLAENLIFKGADITLDEKIAKQQGIHGDTLLHIATEHGHHKIMMQLLNVQACIDTLNACGLSSLHIAINKKDIDAVDMLLKKGAQCDLATRDGITPMQLAALSGDKKIFSLIQTYNEKLKKPVKKAKSIIAPEFKQQFGLFDQPKGKSAAKKKTHHLPPINFVATYSG